jgi:hypothetical protein
MKEEEGVPPPSPVSTEAGRFAVFRLLEASVEVALFGPSIVVGSDGGRRMRRDGVRSVMVQSIRRDLDGGVKYGEEFLPPILRSNNGWIQHRCGRRP